MSAGTVTLNLTKDQLAEIQVALVDRQCNLDRLLKDTNSASAKSYWECQRAKVSAVLVVVAKA